MAFSAAACLRRDSSSCFSNRLYILEKAKQVSINSSSENVIFTFLAFTEKRLAASYYETRQEIRAVLTISLSKNQNWITKVDLREEALTDVNLGTLAKPKMTKQWKTIDMAVGATLK